MNEAARTLRNLTIADDSINGLTTRQIGAKHDLSHVQAANILKTDEIRAKVERGLAEIVDMLPTAVDNYKAFLDSNNEKIQLEATRDITNIVGIRGDRAANNYFVNIMSGNQVNILDASVAEVLHGVLSTSVDVIDVECEDVEDGGL